MGMMDRAMIDAAVDRALVARLGAVRWLARSLDLPVPALDEPERLAAVKARGVAPESCGPDMPVAPARPVEPFAPIAVRPTAKGYDVQHVGFQGRDAARVRDVFDAMQATARSRGGADPFTARQADTGRAYAALVERHSAVGVKGISIEARVSSGGGRGDGGYMDAVLREGRLIAAMREAAAQARVELGAKGSISALTLVDWVCLEGLTMSAVLKRCGVVVDGRRRLKVQSGLAEALDRMAEIGVR